MKDRKSSNVDRTLYQIHTGTALLSYVTRDKILIKASEEDTDCIKRTLVGFQLVEASELMIKFDDDHDGNSDYGYEYIADGYDYDDTHQARTDS